MLTLLLFPFKPLFKLLDVNYNQLYAILTAKLTMDNRRSISFSNNSSKTPKNQIVKQVFLYALLGTILLFTTMVIQSTLLIYTIFFSVVMMMIAIAMISEFTTLLFDNRDNFVLASRPVNNETLAIAKIFHIAIYMLIISLSISLAVIIFTLSEFGVVAMLMLVALLIFTAFFILFLTNIFYFALSNVVSTQRMKDIVVYIQVAMAILFMAAYQLMPRLMDYYEITQIGNMTLKWWHLLVPPVWMSAALDMMIQGNPDTKHIVFLAFAMVIPILSLVLVVKVLSPRFNKAVQQQENTKKRKKTTQITQHKQSWMGWLSRIFTPNIQEAACFEMVWKMSGRERKYKQTVYPVFGYILIFMLIFTFKGKDFSLARLEASNNYLIYLYFPALLSFSLIGNLGFTDNKKSSWLFRTMPIHSVGIVFRGALKAVLFKYFMPVYVIIAAASLYIWNATIVDDILLALIINVLITSLYHRYFIHDLPFTTQKGANDMSVNFITGLLIMIGIVIAVGIHYTLIHIHYAVGIAIVPLFVLMLVLLKTYDTMSWKSIHS